MFKFHLEIIGQDVPLRFVFCGAFIKIHLFLLE